MILVLKVVSLALASCVDIKQASRVGRHASQRTGLDARLVTGASLAHASGEAPGILKALAAVLLAHGSPSVAWQFFRLYRNTVSLPSSPSISRDAAARTSIVMQSEDLLSCPVPELIDSILAPDSTVPLSRENVPGIITRVGDWARLPANSRGYPRSDEQSEKLKKVQRVYETLSRQGFLPSYGSAANSMRLLSDKSTFSEEDMRTALDVKDLSIENVVAVEDAPFAPFALAYLVAIFGLDVYGNFALATFFDTVFVLFIFASLLDTLALQGAVGIAFRRLTNPSYEESVVRHEAGRLLTSYLLGGPALSCKMDAASALTARDFDLVREGVPVPDPEIRNVLKSGELVRPVMDRVATVGMSGVAAEAMVDGSKSRAGNAAFQSLREVFKAADAARIEKAGTGEKQAMFRDSDVCQCRWGFTQATILLKNYRATYNALVLKMKTGITLGEAMIFIEEALEESGETPPPRSIPAMAPTTSSAENIAQAEAEAVVNEVRAKSAQLLLLENEELDLKLEESQERINLSQLKVQKKSENADEELDAKIEMTKLTLEKLALARERKQLEIEKCKLEEQIAKKR